MLAGGRAVGQTDMTMIIAFGNFENAPRNLNDGIQTNVFFLCLLTILHNPEICPFLGHYVACSGNSLSTFRDNLSLSKRQLGITTVRCVITQKSTDLISFAAEA